MRGGQGEEYKGTMSIPRPWWEGFGEGGNCYQKRMELPPQPPPRQGGGKGRGGKVCFQTMKKQGVTSVSRQIKLNFSKRFSVNYQLTCLLFQKRHRGRL